MEAELKQCAKWSGPKPLHRDENIYAFLLFFLYISSD